MSKITNRKAFFEYSMIEYFESGVILTGSEVKSIINGEAFLVDSFCFIENNEIFIKNFKISKYKQSHLADKHDENRLKKLLLKKREINKIIKYQKDKGITIIPIEVYKTNNKFKIKIAVAKGKKTYDKKQTIKERDISREMSRY